MERKRPEKSPELRKPPKRISTSTYFLAALWTTLGIFNACTQNWGGLWVDIGLLVFLAVLSTFQWRTVNGLWKEYWTLKTIQEILDTPMIREDRYSVIFTVILPSDAVMKKFYSFAAQRRETE